MIEKIITSQREIFLLKNTKNIDLIIDTNDEGCDISNLEFKSVIVKSVGQLNVVKCLIQEDLTFLNTIINEVNISLSGSTIMKSINFNSLQMVGDLIFDDCIVKKDINLISCSINGYICLNKSIISGDINCNDTKIENYVYLNETTIKENFISSSSIFINGLFLKSLNVYGNIKVLKSKIHNNLDLKLSKIKGLVIINDSKIGELIDFSGCVCKDVTFKNSIIKGDVKLKNAKIDKFSIIQNQN